jgi:lipopolysaccharide/colanic/teichoic acid biosynthesis glycosyltransferase
LRIGKNGKPFEVFKFRTMVKDADNLLIDYLDNNSHAKAEWESRQKLRKDPRITRVGKWLRIFSLDELPQLLNVLRGEMSIVGPRAVTEEELEHYGEYVDLILRVKPGITGWWQVMGRNRTTWEQRTRLEVYYVSNWSLWLDLYILYKTIWVVLSATGT